jgi:ASPIC and UnbV
MRLGCRAPDLDYCGRYDEWNSNGIGDGIVTVATGPAESTQRVHVGLGPDTKIETLEIRWPSGIRQRATAAVGRITTIRETR